MVAGHIFIQGLLSNQELREKIETKTCTSNETRAMNCFLPVVRRALNGSLETQRGHLRAKDYLATCTTGLDFEPSSVLHSVGYEYKVVSQA